MIQLRRTFVTGAGRRVEYIAEYRIDGGQLIWSGKANLDGDWIQLPRGCYINVQLGLEETTVLSSVESAIERRIAGNGEI